MSIEALKTAIRIAGSQEALGEMIGKDQTTISTWLLGKTKKGVPAEDALLIENAVNGAVTRHELRPDLYPVE